MPTNLIIHGGIYHPFAETSAVLADALADVGIDSTLTRDVEGGLATLADYDLLTVNALRWRMLDHPKYEPFRAEFAMTLSAAGRRAIEAHVARGGGVLALHTACICFGEWAGWGEILGAHWDWGRSFHPPLQAVAVQVIQPDHALCQGIGDFTVEDEIFHHLAPTTALTPLLAARATTDSAPEPLFWARQHGTARVVYDALGHTLASLTHPSHRRLLQRSARWLCHLDDPCAV
ncbi:MAG: ThuA domain-containing protein [Gammaproteobacteria bacterium]